MTLEIEKSRGSPLDPGVVVMTTHCNAVYHGPDGVTWGTEGDLPVHGLNARKHVFGLALASNVRTRDLHIWAYVIWTPVGTDNPFIDGCWRICRYTPDVWADLSARRRIP